VLFPRYVRCSVSKAVDAKTNDVVALAIYPNPSTGIVNIDIPNNEQATNICITDMTGKKVKELTLQSDVNAIDLSDLPKGMYIINIVNDKEQLQEKLVLQ
jgi:hypothetical protein